MNQDLRAKLEGYLSSYQDITKKLSSPDVYSDRNLMKSLNQELTKLEPGVKLFQKYMDIENVILDTKSLLEDEDKEMRLIAEQELNSYEKDLKETEEPINNEEIENSKKHNQSWLC